MKLTIKLLGILIILMGITLLFYPAIIFGWIEDKMNNRSLYIIAIVFRLFLGILFILAAKQSKYPGVIKIIGYLAIITALIFIFVGQESFQKFISILIPEIKSYSRVIGLIVMVVGGFLIYAFSKNKELDQELN